MAEEVVQTAEELLLANLDGKLFKLNTKIKLHRAEFANSYILADGEPGYHTGTNELKVGDGSSSWEDLPIVNKHTITNGTAWVEVSEPEKKTSDAINAANQEAIAGAGQFTIESPDGTIQVVSVGGQTVPSAKAELIGATNAEIVLDSAGSDRRLSTAQPTLNGIKNYLLDSDIFFADELLTI